MAPKRVSPVRYGPCLQRCMVGALCALVPLGGSGLPARAANIGPSPSAIFLIAQRGLSGPFFAHSIVLVMNNLAPAPVGIIINRPTPIPVSRLFPDVERLRHASAKVYFGGPVDFTSVWFLFRAGHAHRHAVHVLDGVFLSADARLLRHLLARRRPMAGLRIFVGHAGWAPGQLQAEIRAGVWTVRKVNPRTIFGHRSQYPWPAPSMPQHGALRPAVARGLGCSRCRRNLGAPRTL